MADPDHRRQGDWVEALFVARAIARGLNVAKPWSGASRYDFLVEINGRTSRVQVKSCSYRRHSGEYQCVYRSFRRPLYTAGQFDFVAIYVLPEDIWYVIPTSALTTVTTTITLRPHGPRSKYFAFEEAWHLLHGGTERPTTAANP